jgi:predicted RNA-binding Zn ribbon-like protein
MVVIMTDVLELHTGSKPAPGELALVQGFVNTFDLEAERDELASPELLQLWLTRHGLLAKGEPVNDGEHEQVLEVREAFRALLLANNGQPLDAGAVALLEGAAKASPLVTHFEEAGTARLEPATTGVSGALGRLFAISYRAMTEGSWPRLKACLSDACHWAFFDHSKNQSGTWCTMAVCGSRMKARAYRRRHKG